MAETPATWNGSDQGKGHTEAPQVTPPSDLFDGELLPEELIAIYNEAVGEGAPPGDSRSEEIPTLPPQLEVPAPETTEDVEKQGGSVHPGARVAETATRLDGGIKLFQNSNSYNDLTTLLTPSGKPAAKTPSTAVPLPTNQTTSPACVATGQSVTMKSSVQQPPRSAATSATGAPVNSQQAVFMNTTKRKAAVPLESATMKKSCQAIAPAARHAHPLVPLVRVLPAGHPRKLVTAHKPTDPIAIGRRPAAPPAALPSALPAPVSGIPSLPNPADVPSAHAPVLPKTPGPESSCLLTQNVAASHATVPEAAVSAPGKAQPKRAATEADFKTVAQAAVSSLILSTKNGEVPAGNLDAGDQDINTSTAHVKALTGSNWVAACQGPATVTTGGAIAADAKASSRSKRQNLTADERARQNRDRNREHARNTRLRKKAYVEELKRTLTELVAQRDKADLEKRQSAQREVEQREVRFRVIEEFLKLRARNETNYASWAAILDSNFSLTLPATNFCAMVNGGHVVDAIEGPGAELEMVFSGVHEAMNESNSFALFLQSLGSESDPSQYAPVGFVYNCDRSNFFMDDSHAVLDWTAGTAGIMKGLSQSEVTMRGSVRAAFCPASNKLLAASIIFDTGAVLSQLQEFMATPNRKHETGAQAASHRADAILHSLQMPQLEKPTIVPQGESSDEGS